MSLLDGLKSIVTGSYLSGESRGKAEDALKDLSSIYEDIKPPELQALEAPDYQFVGKVDPVKVDRVDPISYEGLDPALASLALQGKSEMNNISVDPRLKDAQLNALASLEQVAADGGMTLQDKANLARIQNQASQADRGRRDAIMQNMRRRGMGGSGMELLASLDSSQAATDRHAQQGLDVAGMAQRRALDALMGAGNLGGAIRGQEFAEQSAVAQAQDAINRFNTANTNQNTYFNTGTINDMGRFNTTNDIGVQQFNANLGQTANLADAGYAMTAGLHNASGTQAAADKTTTAGHETQIHNKYTVPQQQFGNQMGVAAGKSGAKQAEAGYYGGQAASEEKGGQAALQGVLEVAAPFVNPTKKLGTDKPGED